MAKLSKKLPKRTTNDKKKAKRKLSWEKNQVAKKERIAEQDALHAYNLKVGSTGKQRRKAA